MNNNHRYQGNPLIKALPSIISRDEAAKRLAHDPGYQEQDRFLPAELRLHLIQSVVEFFEPLAIHLDLEARISRMIRSGYQPHNTAPKLISKLRQLHEERLNHEQ
ncbi:MAG TPA: hypothetical protein VKT82_17110 [Ktedonobacterales bacterium]|nr:hypothetical protein [Ktedonobacterales bacterium]